MAHVLKAAFNCLRHCLDDAPRKSLGGARTILTFGDIAEAYLARFGKVMIVSTRLYRWSVGRSYAVASSSKAVWK